MADGGGRPLLRCYGRSSSSSSSSSTASSSRQQTQGGGLPLAPRPPGRQDRGLGHGQSVLQGQAGPENGQRQAASPWTLGALGGEREGRPIRVLPGLSRRLLRCLRPVCPGRADLVLGSCSDLARSMLRQPGPSLPGWLSASEYLRHTIHPSAGLAQCFAPCQLICLIHCGHASLGDIIHQLPHR
jgi:hypothetical protein